MRMNVPCPFAPVHARTLEARGSIYFVAQTPRPPVHAVVFEVGS